MGYLVNVAAGGKPANGVTPGSDERVARIAARSAVLVALITLAGTVATASATRAAAKAGTTSTTVASAASSGALCTSVIREYRTLLRLDPALVKSLTTAGADGVSPIDVDPDARRCGIDKDAPRVMTDGSDDSD
jgi:hypothetical protein